MKDYGHYQDNCQDNDYCQSWKSFTIGIMNGIKVIGVYTHRTESHMTKKALVNHKSVY